MTILDTIADNTKIRVKQAKEICSLEEMKQKAYGMKKGDFSFDI